MASEESPRSGRSPEAGTSDRTIAAVLYTDIDGSTGLWERHPDVMPDAIAQHNDLITSNVERHGGRVVKNLGDGFLAIFDEPQDAVDAATTIETALHAVDWHLGPDTISVRVAIDLGVIERRDGDIAGPAANRCSRMLDVAHGGQVLISDDVARNVEIRDRLTDLGEFPLRGVEAPVGLHRIEVDGGGAPTGTPGWIGPTGVRSTMRGYDLRGEIGSGAAGVVYRAFQRSVGRDVAIKLIRPEFANDRRFVSRFETEAQFIARLEHPHIVSLYDYWRDPDGAYLVMRWLRGGSLRHALDDARPWDEPSTLGLLQQIGSALSYAHRHGVVHRDVRPSNVLLDEERNGYLSDFGIASRPITVDGLSVSSSPGYASPEESKGAVITAASDQYCLALLAHELLTGRTPDLPFEVQLDGVTPAIVEAITRATALDPSDRFPDVDAFLSALEPAARVADAFVEVSRDPFKGLRPFLEADAADFAGRNELVARLIDAVGQHRLVAAVGASGSGKSSAVRAGLVPALRSGALPGSDGWLITDLYPGARPFDELAMALLSVATEPLPGLVEQLTESPDGLRRAVERVTPIDAELVLVIDQFEELFTLCDATTQRSFIDALVALVSDADARARVVLTLRADFYDRPLAYSSFAPLLDRGLVTIGAPSARELTEAITEPSQNVGLTVDHALVDLIVDQVVDQPGGLPLLQYTLTELFRRREANRLTVEAFHEIGGVTGALVSRAETLYSDLSAAAQGATEQIFLRLVSLDETGEPTRRRVLRTELVGSPEAEAVLDAFGSSRLITFDRDPVTRDPTVEVAHEALLTHWDRLAGWIDARRDDLVTHRRFTMALGEWTGRNQDPSYLLTGPRLAHFETWAGDTHLTLTDSERAFLTLSRTEDNRRQTRRQRIRRLVTAGFAVIALVASVFAVFALVERNRAEENELAAEQARIEAEANAEEALRQQRIAEDQADIADANAQEADRASELARSRELAAAAIATIDEDPQLSILLALEAATVAEPPAASIEALHRAVASQQLIYEIEHSSAFYTSEWALSPDGRYLAITDDGVTLKVIDISQDAEVASYQIPEESLVELETETPAIARARSSEGFPAQEAPCRNLFGTMAMQAVSFSPDGALIATVLGDGFVHVLDASTGRPIDIEADQVLTTIDPESCYPFAVVDFTPDGSGVVVATSSIAPEGWPDFNLDVRIWAVDGSGLIDELTTIFSGSAVDISPDGRWAVHAGFWQHSVVLDDLTGAEARQEFEVAPTVVFDAVFTPDGSAVATASRDGVVRLWDVETQTRVGQFIGPDTALDVSDAGVLVGSGFDGTIYAWDLDTGRPLATLHGHDGVVWDVEVSADGATIASGPDALGRIKVWDIGGVSQTEVSGLSVPADVTVRLDVTEDRVAVLAWDGQLVPGRVLVYDPATWDTVAEIPDQFGRGLRVSDDGTVASQEGIFGEGLTEPLQTAVRVRRLEDLADASPPIRLSGICDAYYEDGTLTAQCPTAPHLAQEEWWPWVMDIDVAPDRGLVAVAAWEQPMTTTVWDMSTGAMVAGWAFEEGYQSGARFDPSGAFLAVGSWDTAYVFAVGEWEQPIATLEGFDSTVKHMDFSPDGSLLAIHVSEANHVQVFDVDTWEPLYELREHQGNVTDLDFSLDGRLLATTGEDGTVRIWDALTGEADVVIPIAGEGERFVRFAPWDQNHLVVASESGQLSVLTLDIEELIEIARNKLFRDFTPSECERFQLDACIGAP